MMSIMGEPGSLIPFTRGEFNALLKEGKDYIIGRLGPWARPEEMFARGDVYVLLVDGNHAFRHDALIGQCIKKLLTLNVKIWVDDEGDACIQNLDNNTNEPIGDIIAKGPFAEDHSHEMTPGDQIMIFAQQVYGDILVYREPENEGPPLVTFPVFRFKDGTMDFKEQTMDQIHLQLAASKDDMHKEEPNPRVVGWTFNQRSAGSRTWFVYVNNISARVRNYKDIDFDVISERRHFLPLQGLIDAMSRNLETMYHLRDPLAIAMLFHALPHVDLEVVHSDWVRHIVMMNDLQS